MLRLTETDVTELIDVRGALEAVEHGLLAEAGGQAQTLQKNVIPYDDGARALHVLSAVAPGLRVSGVKTWVQAGATAQPILMLFDSETAHPMALIEANVLSNLRTGALAGIATKHLAPTTADTLGIVGSGKQAAMMIHAISAVRPLRSIRIWSPNPANRKALADKVQQELGIHATAERTAAGALADASIVGLAARVQQPIISSDMIAHGAHVNSIGTTVPGKSELPQDIFSRFSTICADSPVTVRSLSDEFRLRYVSEQDWQAVQRLADIVKSKYHRPESADLTLYKGMGTGIADLAMGAALLERARACGNRYFQS